MNSHFTVSRGLFSQILTFSSLGFMPAFSTPFFVTFSHNRFLYKRQNVDRSIRDDEQLGAHTDLLCFESMRKTEGRQAGAVMTRYVWSHPGLKPFGNLLPTQCLDCWGLQTWDVVKKTKDIILLRCKAKACAYTLDFRRPSALQFVSGKFVDDGRHGQWLKETLIQIE